jgi:predicted transcriptional regulator
MSGDGDGLFARLAGRLDEDAPAEPSFSMMDLLELPDDERVVMRHVMRRSEAASIVVLAEELGREAAEVSNVVAQLIERRAVYIDGGRVEVATIELTRRSSPGGLWDRLGDL